ncbi:Gfo/Idh/MocA family protein [Psychroflexus lacisalsi]|jgi:predicted dehydrogenase|uniref:Gfo/Idh/MocA family oxidoreductase n=1 Tax=Psychroflexus lacisalsi TaxID=503928 RepID=A0ABP3VC68_9FLAO|nr:Gfo/Idh/MocA family oxidoreductase [Psychroflexus lacisalsi]MBZ9619024.1 Gfo/Idh/MocA family oxidoreductase [Psychroflexus lacisalsi]
MKKTHNWGIIGLGGIAHKFASDLRDVESAQLYAVASRSIKKAQNFASEFVVEKAYGAYETLAKDPKVDIIYIATPHVFHYENTMMCLEHGKAVLCEKPMAINARQLKTMIRTSKEKSLFLMEGLWTNFMPHLQKVNQLNQHKTYGKCLKVEADFSFEAEFDTEKRLFNKGLGGGALLDIGIYPVYLALKLLGPPQEIEASCEFSSTGVDISNQINFKYASVATAKLSSSFAKNTPCKAKVYFENATVELGPSFHQTDQLKIETNSGVDHIDFHYPTHGYQFEIEHVQDCLERKLTQSPDWSLQSSLVLTETLDKIREQFGLVYSEDLK